MKDNDDVNMSNISDISTATSILDPELHREEIHKKYTSLLKTKKMKKLLNISANSSDIDSITSQSKVQVKGPSSSSIKQSEKPEWRENSKVLSIKLQSLKNQMLQLKLFFLLNVF